MAAALVGLATLWLQGACGATLDPAAGSAGASATTTPSPTTSTTSWTTGSGASDAGVCDPEPIPDYVPAGWDEVTDWSCDCRFYVPGSKDVLPVPIAWEPCPEAPDGIDCRVMVTSWTDASAPILTGGKMAVTGTGAAMLAFSRAGDGRGYYLVAEADGPVHTAFMPPYGDGCWFAEHSLSEGMHLIGIQGHKALGPLSRHEGAIGGPIDELKPRVLLHEDEIDNPYGDGWACSNKWVARIKWPFVMTVYSWDMSTEIFVTSQATDPEGLDMSQPVMVGDAFFWTTASMSRSGLNVWDPVGGTRPFIRWVGDGTRGAGNLGTDGVDLVWSYGEGKQPGETVFPVRSIMTAPFTTDPTEVQATALRLRSQPDPPIQVGPWQVGCGYAARDSANKVLVVRLSDGWSWFVPSTPSQKLQRPLGLTCEELFAMGEIGGKYTMGRVRLDSLGPGLLPD